MKAHGGDTAGPLLFLSKNDLDCGRTLSEFLHLGTRRKAKRRNLPSASAFWGCIVARDGSTRAEWQRPIPNLQLTFLPGLLSEAEATVQRRRQLPQL